ncbi:AzlC family ABC transporter permease [Lactobacillus sp. R2/2]|nr:AzlC family ABC transporter permease [Lactobacillus sp. R2/2]
MDIYLTKKSAIKETIPTIFGYIGIRYGFLELLAKQVAFLFFEVCLMSILIYAGSVQLTTLNMLVAGSPIASIVLAAFLVNS